MATSTVWLLWRANDAASLARPACSLLKIITHDHVLSRRVGSKQHHPRLVGWIRSSSTTPARQPCSPCRFITKPVLWINALQAPAGELPCTITSQCLSLSLSLPSPLLVSLLLNHPLDVSSSAQLSGTRSCSLFLVLMLSCLPKGYLCSRHVSK